jgi:phosphonate transport system substrate-binding protein
LLSALAVLLAGLESAPGASPEPEGDLISGPMGVGFTKSCFVNVNRNDAEAAFKVFLQTVGQKRGYLIQPSTRIFDETPPFEAAIKSGAIQIAIMDSWQFLSMDIHQETKPFFVPAERKRIGRQYLLLSRRGSGLNALADLRGKGLIALEVASANLGNHWLNTLLLANRFGTQESFFGSIETVGKPTAALLPVFFGKKPCCLADQASFEVMMELNPQVGRELQVVVGSDSYLDVIVCLGNTGWNGSRGKVDCIEALSELHLEPAGQQILTLFKIGQLVPFDAHQLDDVRKLKAKNQELQKEGGITNAPSSPPGEFSGAVTSRKDDVGRTGRTTE